MDFVAQCQVEQLKNFMQSQCENIANNKNFNNRLDI